MFNSFDENTQQSHPVVTFYRNGMKRDVATQPSIQIKVEHIKRISFNNLYSQLAMKFEFKKRSANDCQLRLFDDQGVEIYQEDLKYLQKDAVLYASDGDDFDPTSCFSEYVLISKLGEGGFGNVLLGEHIITHQKVAIKIVNTSIMGNAQDIDMVFREAEMLKSLRHKNIVNIYKCYTLANMQVVFIMEYLEGGELLSFLEGIVKLYKQEKGRLNEDEARVFIKQIAEAVQYCHQQKLIHRDLKLENILLASKQSQLIKLVDFGIAGLVNNFNMDKIDMGSLKYMAPETLSGKNVKIGPSIDLWALGCILYGLLTGTLPFSGNNSSEVRLSILSLNYRLPQGIEFSLDLRDLLSRILILDPAKRIKIGDILSHPWMTKIALHGSFAGREHKQSHKVNIARETTVKFVEDIKIPTKEVKVPPKSFKPPMLPKPKNFWDSKSPILENSDFTDRFESIKRPFDSHQMISYQDSSKKISNPSMKQLKKIPIPYSVLRSFPKAGVRPFSQEHLNLSHQSKESKQGSNPIQPSSSLLRISTQNLNRAPKQQTQGINEKRNKPPKQIESINKSEIEAKDYHEAKGHVGQLNKILNTGMAYKQELSRGQSSVAMKRSSQNLEQGSQAKLPGKHFRINSSRIG